MHAARLAWSPQRPELVEEACRESRDPELLEVLLNARRPGTMLPAIAARSLARRRDPDVQDLAAHWLSLLE